MNHSALSECELRKTIPATLQAVEELLEGFRNSTVSTLDRTACFAAELLLREALTNAVVHGCHAESGKQVRCSMRLRDRRLLIVVDDDGDGFDWRAARCISGVFSDCSGRGMEILSKYANRVRYNDRGNVATILKRF
jgi:anti-sigma regulatory factor (Ser/Thr protein kinase)